MLNYKEVDPSGLDFVSVVAFADLPPGERLFINAGGVQIVLLNIAGELFAIGDVCSHDNGPLGDGVVEGHEMICPRHGARFDLHTGKASRLPAVENIPAYPVRVKDGMIEIGLPA